MYDCFVLKPFLNFEENTSGLWHWSKVNKMQETEWKILTSNENTGEEIELFKKAKYFIFTSLFLRNRRVFCIWINARKTGIFYMEFFRKNVPCFLSQKFRFCQQAFAKQMLMVLHSSNLKLPQPQHKLEQPRGCISFWQLPMVSKGLNASCELAGWRCALPPTCPLCCG